MRIYCDYASTTPLDEAVKKAMDPFWSNIFGNPGSLHKEGQEASQAIFEARRSIVHILGNNDMHGFKNIIFTGSATEANNLILRGAIKKWEKEKKRRPHIIISAIEHDSITETAMSLKEEGVAVTVVPVTKHGIVRQEIILQSLQPNTVLVSITQANNEVGTIQPIEKITKEIKKSRGEKRYPLVHTDAVQSFQYLPCNINTADAITLSAHKLYGPKGIGVLYVDHGMIEPIITGGGQEEGVRSGTENTPLIIGCAEAIKKTVTIRKKEARRMKNISDRFIAQIEKTIGAQLNGHRTKRLPNNANIAFREDDVESLLIKLDLAGIAVSSGSACSARLRKPSKTLIAMGCSEKQAKQSVRFTFGRQTTVKNSNEIIKKIKSNR